MLQSKILKPVISLHTAISYLKGVGPQKAETLQSELGIFTVGDLLHYFPFRHVDRTKHYKIKDLKPDLPYVQFLARVVSVKEEGKARQKRLKVLVKDDTGTIECVWFKGASWMKKTILPGRVYQFFGKLNYFKGYLSMPHPELVPYAEMVNQQQTALEPVYHSNEKLNRKGLHAKGFAKIIKGLFELHSLPLDIENLPSYTREKYNFPDKATALKHMHFPPSAQAYEQASNRFKYEELFFLQLGMLRTKRNRKKSIKGFVFEETGELLHQFYKEVLPFDLTGAQKRVVKEIRADMKTGFQMNRLLQGDVGSGKTLVALVSMLIAQGNGYQSCLMAPTEILATQHFATFSEMLAGLPIKLALLTGSTKAAARKKMLAELEAGEIDFIIGTHALLEDRVKFKSLGLAVIDEQHRFGVAQRAKLWAKSEGNPPHILVMTATPIPRTLAMSVYGDLDLSVIDEMPPGRKPVTTKHYYQKDRLALWSSVKKEIAKGRQVYIVYPLIEESEKMDYQDLMDGYEAVLRDFPSPQYKVSMVHGKMKPADKEFEMQRFVKGETQIMVATTVIEVGVNVPNASVMLIESAERFGLSQLHQLRGRVGRGAEQSYCLLITDYQLSKEAKLRISTMCETNDGFEIAEVDMRLRGPGDMLGTRQSGDLDLKVASLVHDGHWLKIARDDASQIIAEDHELQKEEHQGIKKYYNQGAGKKSKWGLIS